MAKRSPAYMPVLDECETISLADPYPASIDLLNQIANHAHALATGFGYPMHVQGCFVQTNDADVGMQHVVPPGVSYVQLGICADGSGTVTFTDSITSDTTTIEWHHGEQSIDSAKWAWTNNAIDDSAAASLGYALKVRASTAWLPMPYNLLTVNPADSLGASAPTGTIYAVAIRPIHQVVTL